MSAEQIRNRTVGCKMTDSEYERLSGVVESEGMTLGEWVREVLLERVEGRKPSAIEEALLAEVLALRTILLNLHFAVAKGEAITAEGMQAIIDRARNLPVEPFGLSLCCVPASSLASPLWLSPSNKSVANWGDNHIQ